MVEINEKEMNEWIKHCQDIYVFVKDKKNLSPELQTYIFNATIESYYHFKNDKNTGTSTAIIPATDNQKWFLKNNINQKAIAEFLCENLDKNLISELIGAMKKPKPKE